MSNENNENSPSYIPVPGDVVRIVDVSPDDGYASYSKVHLVLDRTLSVQGGVRYEGNGWVGFDGVDSEKDTYVFYKVRVELVRSAPVTDEGDVQVDPTVAYATAANTSIQLPSFTLRGRKYAQPFPPYAADTTLVLALLALADPRVNEVLRACSLRLHLRATDGGPDFMWPPENESENESESTTRKAP